MAVNGVARRLVAGLASRAPVAVFPAVGAGAWDRVEALRLRPRIRLVDSPRHGTVLLVAGSIPARFGAALDRVHDQLTQPRATVWWGAEADVDDAGGGVARMNRAVHDVDAGTDPEPVLLDVMRALLEGVRAGEEHRLPDEPPAPWRGRGDWGQGGKGMMGGVPYGRPMAMTADDIRDGLTLDRLSFTVGPFFPPFPPGLVLRLALQGDVVQSAEVVEPPFPQASPQMPGSLPVPDIEGTGPDAARARRGLRRAARLLRVAGADALADRALGLANAPVPQPGRVRSLRSLVRRGGVLRALPVPRDSAGVDVRARLLAWLGDAERVLGPGAVAGREEDVRVRGQAREAPDAAAGEGLDRLPGLLSGLEWGNAMLLINALDLVPRGSGEAS